MTGDDDESDIEVVVVTEVGELFDNLLDKWSLSRPEIKLDTAIPAHEAQLKIRYDQSLQHALMNLLNNAADVSPEFVSMKIGSASGWLLITIEDHGPGIPADIAKKAGQETGG